MGRSGYRGCSVVGEYVSDLATAPVPPSGTALLQIRYGPERGSIFEITGESITVGRLPASDVLLNDMDISRRHAEFRRSGNTFTLTDLGSLNGTYVDRQRIEGETLLAPGCEIQIGKFRFTFFAPVD